MMKVLNEVAAKKNAYVMKWKSAFKFTVLKECHCLAGNALKKNNTPNGYYGKRPEDEARRFAYICRSSTFFNTLLAICRNSTRINIVFN